MIERPMLFGAPMVRALLDGSKSQTRRVVKSFKAVVPAYGVEMDCIKDWDGHPSRLDLAPRDWEICPYGVPGDRLWVRETWRVMGESPEDTLDMFDRDDIQYRADRDEGYIGKYRPSIHMPRRFSRIDLEVTGVRVERLQDISEADAVAEGCVPARLDDDDARHMYTARWAYEILWDQINGPGSWAANPWVWVVEFKRVKP